MSDRPAIVELVAGSAVAAILSLAYIIYAGRILGPAEYGDVSAALSILYLFSMAFSPVMPTVSRFVALYSLRNETGRIVAVRDHLARRLLIWIGIPALVALTCAVPLQRLFHFRSVWTVVLTVACVVAFLALSVDRGVLQGLARFRDYNKSTILESAIRLFGAIALLRLARSASVALVSYVAGLAVASVLLRLRLRRDFRDADARDVDPHEVMRFAAPMLVLMIAFAVQQNADMLAAKRWLAPATAGEYGAAFGLARLFAVITAPFFILIVPRITAEQEAGRRIGPAALRICGAFLLVATPALAMFAAGRETIVVGAYGRQFIGAADLLIPLSLLAIVSNLGLLLAQAFASAGRFAIVWKYAAAAAVEIVLLSFLHATAAMIIWPVVALQTVVVAYMAGAILRAR